MGIMSDTKEDKDDHGSGAWGNPEEQVSSNAAVPSWFRHPSQFHCQARADV